MVMVMVMVWWSGSSCHPILCFTLTAEEKRQEEGKRSLTREERWEEEGESSPPLALNLGSRELYIIFLIGWLKFYTSLAGRELLYSSLAHHLAEHCYDSH
jgi:hypothetical protein